MGLTVRNAVKLWDDNDDSSVDINAIIFLDIFALALGFFSHFLGMYQAAGIMGQMPPGMIAAGYGQSLLALLYGFGIFFISAFCWMGLRWKALASAFSPINILQWNVLSKLYQGSFL